MAKVITSSSLEPTLELPIPALAHIILLVVVEPHGGLAQHSQSEEVEDGDLVEYRDGGEETYGGFLNPIVIMNSLFDGVYMRDLFPSLVEQILLEERIQHLEMVRDVHGGLGISSAELNGALQMASPSQNVVIEANF